MEDEILTDRTKSYIEILVVTVNSVGVKKIPNSLLHCNKYNAAGVAKTKSLAQHAHAIAQYGNAVDKMLKTIQFV